MSDGSCFKFNARLLAIQSKLVTISSYAAGYSWCQEGARSPAETVNKLNKRVDHLENRSRRNDFVVYDVEESSAEKPYQSEESVVRDIVPKKIGATTKSVEGIHRLGRKSSGKQKTVIVKF